MKTYFDFKSRLNVNLPPHFYPLLLATLIASHFFLGCAAISVEDTKAHPPAPQQLPKKIILLPYRATPKKFIVQDPGPERTKIIHSEQKALALDLQKRLQKYIAPTMLKKEKSNLPTGNYWLVEGSWDKVIAGNRYLRAVIGLGAGKSIMSTTTTISYYKNRAWKPFLTIKTTGGSGIAPGAASALTPIGPLSLSNILVNAGGSASGGLMGGVSADRKRTAREIVAALLEYLDEAHLPIKKKGVHPKRLGHFPDYSPEQFF
jgi:hypothetical protein